MVGRFTYEVGIFRWPSGITALQQCRLNRRLFRIRFHIAELAPRAKP